MIPLNKIKAIHFVTCLVLLVSSSQGQDLKKPKRYEWFEKYLEFDSYVDDGWVDPHWFEDGSRFWFIDGPPENMRIYKIDPGLNSKEELFDVKRLRKALAAILEEEPPHKGVPFEDFVFLDGEKNIKFQINDKIYILEFETYAIKEAADQEKKKEKERPDYMSPEGYWVAVDPDNNLWLHSSKEKSKSKITEDGGEFYKWDFSTNKWSPDYSKLALIRIDERNVLKRPIVKWLSPTEDVTWLPKPIPGHAVRQWELYILDIPTKNLIQVSVGKNREPRVSILGWRPDESELFFSRENRGSLYSELMAADPVLGSSRVVLKKVAGSMLFQILSRDYETDGYFCFLEDGKRFLMVFEEYDDTLNRLYVCDVEGQFIRRLTSTDLRVERIVTVDEKTGWIYFIARGDEERPFDKHLYRVDIEGNNLKRLTEASANHDCNVWINRHLPETIRFSPSKKYFIDTYSTINQPTVVELRKADGTLLQTLVKVNIDRLKEELKWIPPEEFTVTAADGKTPIHGVLFKPYDFNPQKKYPVIEMPYMDEAVPHTFNGNGFNIILHARAQLGFITFMVDGRGLPGRGKEFRTAFYKDDYPEKNIDDHVATVKELARKRSYIDIDRVGIHGWSGGTSPALLAMLKAPEIYKVGVVISLLQSDARTDYARWIEALFGLPKDNPERYDRASLLRYAGNLKGKLLLMHATSDKPCYLSHTFKVVDALIKNNKRFDLLIFPEETHGFGRNFPYMMNISNNYFIEHLKPDIGN